MVDKEIIIDGVDVSECSYGELEKYIFKCSCEYNARTASMFCKDNPNCYFKQLARAEDKINYMEEYIKIVENTRNDLKRELEQKEQECKELMKDCPKVCKSDIYKQALDEIEKCIKDVICKEECGINREKEK